MKYSSFASAAESVGRHIHESEEREIVCIQGLGFVGSAMAVAVASARDENDEPYFNVIGIDLPNAAGRMKAGVINKGKFPVACNDHKLLNAMEKAYTAGNLIAVTDMEAFSLASVTVVDVPLDVITGKNLPTVEMEGFKSAMRTLGEYMPSGALVIVETTVPPGTCEKVAVPVLAETRERRGLPGDSLLVAHSYERVMPGTSYLDSIVNFWRVYAGHTEEAAEKCGEFLAKVINTDTYPLTRLESTLASETAKVLENSYRAVNIAFIEEFGRFAEANGIDLYEIIAAIRMRPTHNNIRQPGFGVGGYCLTKDPLLSEIAARELLGQTGLEFPFCSKAVSVNKNMPMVTLEKLRELLGGDLKGKTILLLGVSYLPDVADTRHSPSGDFYDVAREYGAEIICHDPLVGHWEEKDILIHQELPEPSGFDAIVLAVAHKEYKAINYSGWLGNERPLIFDANNVLGNEQLIALKNIGCPLASIGRGNLNE